MVLIHGLSRNYDDYFDLNYPYAKEKNYTLIIPKFKKYQFGNYNILSTSNKNKKRADLVLKAILEDFSNLSGIELDKINLLGFSAGAQFAHRYSLLYPEQINKLFICSSGSYTFLDETLDYPAGIKSNTFNFMNKKDEFLKIPIYLYVGEDDTSREGSINKAPILDKLQGKTRVDRAKNWYKHIKTLKDESNIKSDIKFEIIDNSSHNFKECMHNGMSSKIWKELF